MESGLSDMTCERAVLSGVVQFGEIVYYDIVDIVSESTFTSKSNAIIWKAIKHLYELDSSAAIDPLAIECALNSIGLADFLNVEEERRYLRAIFNMPLKAENVGKNAAKIRKLEIARHIHSVTSNALYNLEQITGDESIDSILQIVESPVLSFTDLLSSGGSNEPVSLGTGISEYLDYLESNPVEMLGISTGFPEYDKSIGGGLQKGTVNLIGARTKVGKSLLAENIALNISRRGIRVLNLDTEMTETIHKNRSLSILSGVPLELIKTGKYVYNPVFKKRVRDAAQVLESCNYDYESVVGKPFEEVISIMNRWIRKSVGKDESGNTNPCVVIYDYIKLTTSDGLNSSMQEYQKLGFQMTGLHNFTVRNQIPCLALGQLNRDGINSEGTASISGSDRLIWLCSNYSIYKYKSPEEIANDREENGNRKIIPVVARDGPCLDDNDYICVNMDKYSVAITEIGLKSAIAHRPMDTEGFVVDDNDEDESSTQL